MIDPHLIDIGARAENALIAAARDGRPVQGLTHNHYRYPARFSGVFARSVIEAFTRPGDLVLDPHVGGGTTLVEATAAGRNAVGVDVSTLAEFVSGVKTAVYDDAELKTLKTWANSVKSAVAGDKIAADWTGGCQHLDHPDRRGVGAAIGRALSTTASLAGRLRDFARCVILRTAQVALDGRRKPLDADAFGILLERNAEEMIEAASAYGAAVVSHTRRPAVDVLLRSSNGLEQEARAVRHGAPRLVLTSPPYPGVHVLYHRWQVGGGRETAAPFLIAARGDGAGSSFYTMGDRKAAAIDGYFSQIGAGMRSVASLCNGDSTIVQMLAFADASTQLPRYLEVMADAGLAEAFLPSLADVGDGRLWREVPNRRWYAGRRGATPASREVVLFHRLQEGEAPAAARLRPAERQMRAKAALVLA